MSDEILWVSDDPKGLGLMVMDVPGLTDPTKRVSRLILVWGDGTGAVDPNTPAVVLGLKAIKDILRILRNYLKHRVVCRFWPSVDWRTTSQGGTPSAENPNES